MRWRLLGAIIAVGTLSGGAFAQDRVSNATQPSGEKQRPTMTESVVVTASRVEEKPQDAPASLSVITAQTIGESTARSIPELIATTPGMNAIQTSARDFNLTSRGATKTTANTQLVLIDGRTIYQDFLGFVLWDAVPIQPEEIRQIEVIRGPASAVWGGNAMDGVINIRTQSPRELATLGSTTAARARSTSVTLETGLFTRNVAGSQENVGAVGSARVTHAAGVSDRLAYKVSAGFSAEDALPRPSGTIENAFHTPYPAFNNSRASTPRADARIDYTFPAGNRQLVVNGGFAGVQGIMHTGSGPFEIQNGSAVGYGQAALTSGATRITGFVNVTSGEAPSLLSVDSTGQPIRFRFENQTYDGEVGSSRIVATRHNLHYGGVARYSRFDVTVAPLGRSRSEFGGYLQDQIALGDRVQLHASGRVDKLAAIDHAVFSPRTAVVVRLPGQQILRASMNQAFRSPTLINNYLDLTLATSIDLGAIVPALAGQSYVFPVSTIGNQRLKEESVTTYEIAHSVTFDNDRSGSGSLSAAYYVNDKDRTIFLGQTSTYTSTTPPPSWPLPLFILDAMNAAGVGLPAVLQDMNWGHTREQGIELSGEWRYKLVRTDVNYAWQKAPSGDPVTVASTNVPPAHHVNVRATYSGDRFYYTLGVQAVGAALWRDVLDARFHGPTDRWTSVDLGGGLRWAQGKRVLSVSLTNLANREIRQHVFGDILKRRGTVELRVRM